jgi:signal transduction histidine kinase
MECLPPSDCLTPRTPLTLINAPIRDLLRDVKDSKQREKLNLAARNIDRLSRLVDSLMDFSRLEAGRFEGILNLLEYQVTIDHLFPQVGSLR